MGVAFVGPMDALLIEGEGGVDFGLWELPGLLLLWRVPLEMSTEFVDFGVSVVAFVVDVAELGVAVNEVVVLVVSEFGGWIKPALCDC